MISLQFGACGAHNSLVQRDIFSDSNRGSIPLHCSSIKIVSYIALSEVVLGTASSTISEDVRVITTAPVFEAEENIHGSLNLLSLSSFSIVS